MKVITLVPLKLPMGEIPPGRIIKIADNLVQKLTGKVCPVEQCAWLAAGELRTRGIFPDLAGEIVQLTKGDLALQKVLLLRHCEEYDHHHFWRLAEEWEERAAIMQHDGGMNRKKAEIEAARCLNLLAFLDDLQEKEVQAA